MSRRTLMTLRFGWSRFTSAHQRCFVVGNQTRTPKTQAHRWQPTEVESERVGSSRRAEVQVAREGRAIFQQSQTIPAHSHALWQFQPNLPGVCASHGRLDHASIIRQHSLARHFIHFICLCYLAILLGWTSGMEILIRVLVCFLLPFSMDANRSHST